MSKIKSNPLLSAAVALIIILVLIWVSGRLAHKRNPAGQQPAQENNKATSTVAAMPDLQSVPANNVPAGFPSGIPWEKNAAVLQNFTAKDPQTGKTQSTRVYISGKTMDENFAIYQKYLQNGGWIISSSIDQPAVKNLDAGKDGARFDITIAKDSKGEVTVNVSYVD